MAAVTPDSAQKGLPLTLPPPSAGCLGQEQAWKESTSSSNLLSSSVDSKSGEHSDDANFGVEIHAKPGHGHHVWGGVSANNSSHDHEEIQTPYMDEDMLESRGINPMEIVFHQHDSHSSDWTDSSESVRADPMASVAFGEPDSLQNMRWVDVECNSEDSCSDSDPDTAKPKCSPETERAVQRQKELLRAEVGDDIEKLRGRVPQDREGKPTSIGSLGHAAGSCKACIFVNSKSGCSNGVSCGFCHFPHKRRRNKVRPCKGKRERHLKLLARVLAQIDHDPDSFSLDKLKLPPSIVCEESTRAKFIAKVESHLQQVKSARSCPGTQARSGAASSSGAASGMPTGTISERSAEKPNKISL